MFICCFAFSYIHFSSFPGEGMIQLKFLFLFCTGALAQHYDVGKCPAEIPGVSDFKEKDVSMNQNLIEV